MGVEVVLLKVLHGAELVLVFGERKLRILAEIYLMASNNIIYTGADVSSAHEDFAL